MIIDNQLVFSNNQAVTSTADSTNTIDLLGGISIGQQGIAAVGWGEELGLGVGGMNPQVLCIVNTAFTASGAGTMTVAFQGSSDNSTWNVYVQTPAIGKADLTVGRQVALWPWPARPDDNAASFPLPRYFKMTYTVATGPMTAGKIYSAIILDRFAPVYYVPGFTVGV